MKLIKKLGCLHTKKMKNRSSFGLFLCPYCGKEVERQMNSGKKYKSCGCMRDKLARESNTKHGDAKIKHIFRLYRTWTDIKRRCYNKNEQAYKNYGGRGIAVCDEWKNDYVTFKTWALENGYKDNLSIDRIDNDGNYEPDNCKWSTRKEQARNTRSNKMITYGGETHCLTDWAEKLGMNFYTLQNRLGKLKWSVERALTTKVRSRKKKGE